MERPPAGMNHDDLAVWLLRAMGIGWSQINAVAASEALRLKGCQPKFDVPLAYEFILKQWAAYKASAHYQSQWRRKAGDWLREGDYDNPQSWGDRPILAFQPKKSESLTDVERWRRDKQLHPEKYPTPEETKEFFSKVNMLLERKRMPENLTPDIKQLTQNVARDSSTVGSRHSLEVPKNNGPEQ